MAELALGRWFDRMAATKTSFKSLTKVVASGEEVAWKTKQEANTTSHEDEEDEGEEEGRKEVGFAAPILMTNGMTFLHFLYLIFFTS